MANIFRYIDGEGTDHLIYEAGVTTERIVLDGTETGAEHPRGDRQVDKSPFRLAKRYQTTGNYSREYGFDCLLMGTSFSDLQDKIENWEDWHDPEKGEGYIQRTTYNGHVRCLDCIPLDPEWQQPEGTNIVVTQRYLAANPWWRDATATTVSLVTSNSATVYATTSNVGSIPAFTTITITGIVKRPKLTDESTGEWIEVRKSTSNADDEIRIDGRPSQLTAKYYEHGAGDGVHVALQPGSRFITIPTGSHSLSFTATSTSGNVTALVSYYQYYRSL